jgi:hypothetical protein
MESSSSPLLLLPLLDSFASYSMACCGSIHISQGRLPTHLHAVGDECAAAHHQLNHQVQHSPSHRLQTAHPDRQQGSNTTDH